MMELLQCNRCKKTESKEKVDWYEVRPPKSFWNPPGKLLYYSTFHFCSMQCLKEFFDPRLSKGATG